MTGLRIEMPTTAQVRELPELVRIRVPREWEDMNGHVNVQYHVAMYNECTDPILAMLGIDQEWVRTERVGLFDLEHHIWYQNEVHVGDEVGCACAFRRAQCQTHAGRRDPAERHPRLHRQCHRVRLRRGRPGCPPHGDRGRCDWRHASMR